MVLFMTIKKTTDLLERCLRSPNADLNDCLKILDFLETEYGLKYWKVKTGSHYVYSHKVFKIPELLMRYNIDPQQCMNGELTLVVHKDSISKKYMTRLERAFNLLADLRKEKLI